MTSPRRPTLRPIFLEKRRRLRVYFYTSSVQKYLQAKHVLGRYGLELSHFRHDRPYAELEDRTSEELLVAGIDEILQTVGSTSLFFIEDTSVRIDALSSQGRDVPGLSVKEWFSRTTFEQLDEALPSRPDGRGATVCSDIALHVPGLTDPVLFHGETSGVVAPSAPDFSENRYHPWLTPKTFNGWFIPDGASLPLGAMSFEESWKYDFRVRSLAALVARLEEYAAVANAGPAIAFAVDRPTTDGHTTPSLFGLEQGRVLVVVGSTCAGKTTFGLNAKRHFDGFEHVEASAVLGSTRRAHERSDALAYAQRALREQGADLVARRAMSMFKMDQGGDFVITGFRTIEEVLYLREHCPQLEIVLVEASERTRYARDRARGRDDPASLSEFRAKDQNQWAFGLLRVAEEFCDYRIENEGSQEDYRLQVEAVLAGIDVRGVTKNVRPRHQLSVHRLYRCLDILEESGRPMSCDEVEVASQHPPRLFRERQGGMRPQGRYTGKPILHNNANKVLKAAPELVRRLETPGERVRYQIRPAGHAYLRLMNDYNARAWGGDE